MTIEISPVPKFSYPGKYLIRVTGNVRKDIFEYFQELEKSEVKEEMTERLETHLKIRIRDQAELIGLLNILYEWQHVLISVELGEKYSTNQTIDL